MEIQHQVKNNANELNDFLRGMKSWQQEMQAKDKQLLDAAKIKKEEELEKAPSSRKLVSPPPKRVIKKSEDLSKTKKKSKEALIAGASDKLEKIKAYDYSAWDKFDVDKACDEVDKEVSQESPQSERLSGHDIESNHATKSTKSHGDSMSIEEKRTQNLISKQQAASEKERGNEYFKVMILVNSDFSLDTFSSHYIMNM